MEPAADPPAKRQRKEPAWKAGYVDPSRWKDIKEGIAAPAAPTEGETSQQASPSPGGGDEDDSATKVLSSRPLDFNRAEVTVLHKGRRYRGIVDRTGLPQSIGVATQVRAAWWGKGRRGFECGGWQNGLVLGAARL
jgi:hypothetical protein